LDCTGFYRKGDIDVRDLTKSGLNIVGVLFAMLLLGYTGFQTFTLLLEVSGSPLVAAIGLIMFEAGMIYWWFVFRNDAEGLPQMALSFLVFLACLTFVIMATALQLGAVGADALGENTPAKIITAAAVIQLTAKLFFPILHPDTMNAIIERVQDGKITSAANKKFDKAIDGIADGLADEMVTERTNRFVTALNTKYQTQYQLSSAPTPRPVHVASSAPVRPSLTDKILGRKPAPPQGEVTPVAESLPNEAALMSIIQDMIARGELAAPLGQNTQSVKPNGPPPPVIRGAGAGDGGGGDDANFTPRQ
jgi:hypothetical protein